MFLVVVAVAAFCLSLKQPEAMNFVCGFLFFNASRKGYGHVLIDEADTFL